MVSACALCVCLSDKMCAQYSIAQPEVVEIIEFKQTNRNKDGAIWSRERIKRRRKKKS